MTSNAADLQSEPHITADSTGETLKHVKWSEMSLLMLASEPIIWRIVWIISSMVWVGSSLRCLLCGTEVFCFDVVQEDFWKHILHHQSLTVRITSFLKNNQAIFLLLAIEMLTFLVTKWMELRSLKFLSKFAKIIRKLFAGLSLLWYKRTLRSSSSWIFVDPSKKKKKIT